MTNFQAIGYNHPTSTASLFVPCYQLMQSLISPLNIKKTAPVGNYLDLSAAARLFDIDREILLAAIVERQLPSTFDDSGDRIAYKDLEQFVDRYFYRKDPNSGDYLLEFEG